ncbi:MAG: GNAT family N-acetyltransferase [Promethearchaeota archaeon]
MQIRSFQSSDRETLLEISKHTWGGYDQLPYELDELLANPSSYLYVLEYRNRVVAFANINVIDEGKTGWLEHMRVHWRYRKRGFAWVMTQGLIAKAETLGVNRLRLATTVENEATHKIATRLKMRQVLQMKLFWKGNYRGIRWKHSRVPVKACSADEAYAILRKYPKLIPEGIITYNWHCFDFSKMLLEAMETQFQFWKIARNDTIGALSMGFQQLFHGALMWVSTIYALDEGSFHSALSHQLQAAKDVKAQGVLCFHSSPYQAGQKIPGLKRNTFATELVLLEKRQPFTPLS